MVGAVWGMPMLPQLEINYLINIKERVGAPVGGGGRKKIRTKWEGSTMVYGDKIRVGALVITDGVSQYYLN